MTTWKTMILAATQSPQSPGTLTFQDKSVSLTGTAGSNPAFLPILRPLAKGVATAWKWLERKRVQQLAARRLRVAETISLGEKRFVSIVEVDGAQFLIGGAAGSVSLLAVLGTENGSSNQSGQSANVSVETGR